MHGNSANKEEFDGTNMTPGKACFSFPTSIQEWSLWFEFNGRYRLQAAKLVQLLIALLIIFITTTFIYHYRICSLEADRDSFMTELLKTREEMKLIRSHFQIPIDSDPNTATTDSDAWAQSFRKKEEFEYEEDQTDPPLVRTRRDVKENEAKTNFSLFTSDESSSSLNDSSEIPDESVDPGPLTILMSRSERARKLKIKERGNLNMIKEKSNPKGKNGRLKKLKKKLEACRRRYKSVLSTAELNIKASSTCTGQPQAVHIIPTGEINIEKQRQFIGPWYIAPNGNDIGFNDLWYQGLSLDKNRTSIIFTESGLFQISSQVYYHLSLDRSDKALPMGYRMYLRKNEQMKQFRRPIPLAECVPSYPRTYYQTCFTQVTWFMDAGDEIHLEHFTKSLPMIEAGSQGKTFITVVKLSGS